MKLHNSVLIIAVVIIGCASPHSELPSMSHGNTGKTQSICDLAERGFTDGLIARVKATYKTDKSHYAYILSKGCGLAGVLNIADMEPVSAGTVQDFYAAGDRRCVQAGTPYICVLEARIDVDIKIVRGQSKNFAAEMLKVHNFSFVGAETESYSLPEHE